MQLLHAGLQSLQDLVAQDNDGKATSRAAQLAESAARHSHVGGLQKALLQ